jgi:hypothetical protein
MPKPGSRSKSRPAQAARTAGRLPAAKPAARAKSPGAVGGRSSQPAPRVGRPAASTAGADLARILTGIQTSLNRILAAIERLASDRAPIAAPPAPPAPPAAHAAASARRKAPAATRELRGAPRAPAVAAPRTPTLAEPAEALGERLAEMQASIDALLAATHRLQSVPAAEVAALDLDARRRRAHALADAFLAIEELENAKLRALNEAFESRREELHAATRRLAGDLARIEGTVAFIDAAASAIGIVANVLSLAR